MDARGEKRERVVVVKDDSERSGGTGKYGEVTTTTLARDDATFQPLLYYRTFHASSGLCGSTRSSSAKSIPANDLFLMCLSSSSLFASHKCRSFKPSFTYKKKGSANLNLSETVFKLTTMKTPSPRVFRHLGVKTWIDKLRYIHHGGRKKRNVPNRVARSPFLARRE
jgi:hypothetical protein